jgi:AraC family transcriptional regulator, transcriptional activator of pobA
MASLGLNRQKRRTTGQFVQHTPGETRMTQRLEPLSQIPNYALYGDAGVAAGSPSWLDIVHIEQIHERSSLFDFDIAPHVHHGLIQVLYITRGGGTVMIDGQQWNVAAPSLVIVPTPVVHGFRFLPTVDGPVVTAAQQPLESIAAVAAPSLLRHIREPRVMDVSGSPRHADALLPLFAAIEHESRVHTSGQANAGTALLLAVFVQIARIVASLHIDAAGGSAGDVERSRKAERIERFRTLVDAHFRARWSVEQYAAEVGLSAGQLSRLCRELIGMSALDVLNARIVHEAERELVYSNLGIKQIAGLLGYADEAYFGRFFRKQTGRTPSEFRDKARQQLAPVERVQHGGKG